MGISLVGSCPGGKLSWGVVLIGSYPVGNCPDMVWKSSSALLWQKEPSDKSEFL